MSDEIHPGDTFATPYESGCIALEGANDNGNFDALDSDGVLCGFNLRMVVSIAHTHDPVDIAALRASGLKAADALNFS